MDDESMRDRQNILLELTAKNDKVWDLPRGRHPHRFVVRHPGDRTPHRRDRGRVVRVRTASSPKPGTSGRVGLQSARPQPTRSIRGVIRRVPMGSTLLSGVEVGQ